MSMKLRYCGIFAQGKNCEASRQQLLGNGSANTPIARKQILITQQQSNWKRCSLHGLCDSYIMQQQKSWEKCFLCGPCWGVISRTSLEFSQLWNSRWPVRTWTWKLMKLWHWKLLPGDNQCRYSNQVPNTLGIGKPRRTMLTTRIKGFHYYLFWEKCFLGCWLVDQETGY
jgi:hypothetical protein